jgi:hypothetical protein
MVRPCSLLVVFLVPAILLPQAKPAPGVKKARPGLLVRFTFAAAKDGRVEDVSGNRLVGKLAKGKLVKDDTGPSLELEGEGALRVGRSTKLNVADSPLVLGAWCHPGDRRGVVAALGGESNGLSLYLKDGVPTFAVRSADKLTIARAENRLPVGRWAHLMGVLDAAGRLRVWVDGKPSGDAVQGALLAKQPADGLSIGADTGSLVGDYRDEQHWTGRLRDVRLYRGVPADRELRQWAGLAK